MTSLCRHLSPTSIAPTAQEIVNWVTTADECLHSVDTTQLDFASSLSANLFRLVETVANEPSCKLWLLSRVGVGGVYWALETVSARLNNLPTTCRLFGASDIVWSDAYTYLADDIRLVSEGNRRSPRSSFDNMCAVPRPHNSFGDRSFGAAGPRICNTHAKRPANQ